MNFGDVQISRALDFPKPQKVGALSGVHGVASDNIVVVDAQTLLIPSFSYDGEAPGTSLSSTENLLVVVVVVATFRKLTRESSLSL